MAMLVYRRVIDILGSWTKFSQKHQLANPDDLALKNHVGTISKVPVLLSFWKVFSDGGILLH